jgi:hypothetical protein
LRYVRCQDKRCGIKDGLIEIREEIKQPVFMSTHDVGEAILITEWVSGVERAEGSDRGTSNHRHSASRSPTRDHQEPPLLQNSQPPRGISIQSVRISLIGPVRIMASSSISAPWLKSGSETSRSRGFGIEKGEPRDFNIILKGERKKWLKNR